MERLSGDGPHAAEMHAFARALNDVSLAQLDGPREPRQTSGWALLDPAGVRAPCETRLAIPCEQVIETE